MRHAMRTGDQTLLERRVDWENVRRSLKASILQAVSDMRSGGRSGPDDDAREGRSIGILQAMKLAIAPRIADRLIDQYVTPQGVAGLTAARGGLGRLGNGAKLAASGELSLAMDALSSPDEEGRMQRFLSFYSRIQRAEFRAFDLVEFEIVDRHKPSRRFISEFKLVNLEWKLIGVRLQGEVF